MNDWTWRLACTIIVSILECGASGVMADDVALPDVEKLQKVWESRADQIQTARIQFRFAGIPPRRIDGTLGPQEVARRMESLESELTIETLPQLVKLLSSAEEDVGNGIDVTLSVDGSRRSEDTHLVRQSTNAELVIRHSKSNGQVDITPADKARRDSHRMSDLAIPVPSFHLKGDKAGRLSVERVDGGRWKISGESTSGHSRIDLMVSEQDSLIHRMDVLEGAARTLTKRIDNFGHHQVDGIWFPAASAALSFRNGKLHSAYIRIVEDAQFNRVLDADTFDVPVKAGETVVDRRLDPPHIFKAAADVSDVLEITARGAAPPVQ